eukprot:2535719-Rhodomonas_salina.1
MLRETEARTCGAGGKAVWACCCAFGGACTAARAARPQVHVSAGARARTSPDTLKTNRAHDACC